MLPWSASAKFTYKPKFDDQHHERRKQLREAGWSAICGVFQKGSRKFLNQSILRKWCGSYRRANFEVLNAAAVEVCHDDAVVANDIMLIGTYFVQALITNVGRHYCTSVNWCVVPNSLHKKKISCWDRSVPGFLLVV
jgi:hypothetical protein